MKKIVFSIAWLLLFLSVTAQKNFYKQKGIGLSVGWQQIKFYDQHASPLIYKAKAFPNAGLYYHHQTNRSLFDLKLSGGKGTANPERFGKRDYEVKWNDTSGFAYQVSSEFIHANIEATYLQNLSSVSTNRLNYWVGGSISEQAYYADEVANFPWILNAVDLSPAFQLNYAVQTKQNMGIRIDFASIGILSRSVYSFFAKSNKDKNVPAFFKQGTRVVSVNQFQKVNIDLFYKYYAAQHFAIGADYQIKWFRYSIPKPIRAVDTRFNLNFEYAFH